MADPNEAPSPAALREMADEGTESAFDILEGLRHCGWSVAVHNDYREKGRLMTFWLLADGTGRYIKGEGATDQAALVACLDDRDRVLRRYSIYTERVIGSAAGKEPKP